MLDSSGSTDEILKKFDELAGPATGVPVAIPPWFQMAMTCSQMVFDFWAPFYGLPEKRNQ